MSIFNFIEKSLVFNENFDEKEFCEIIEDTNKIFNVRINIINESRLFNSKYILNNIDQIEIIPTCKNYSNYDEFIKNNKSMINNYIIDSNHENKILKLIYKFNCFELGYFIFIIYIEFIKFKQNHQQIEKSNSDDSLDKFCDMNTSDLKEMINELEDEVKKLKLENKLLIEEKYKLKKNNIKYY